MWLQMLTFLADRPARLPKTQFCDGRSKVFLCAVRFLRLLRFREWLQPYLHTVGLFAGFTPLAWLPLFPEAGGSACSGSKSRGDSRHPWARAASSTKASRLLWVPVDAVAGCLGARPFLSQLSGL